MDRRVVLTGLLALFIVGWLLVLTADDDGPALERVVTGEGLETEIPEGWVVTDRPFEFVPADADAATVDRWVVARACGDAGCGGATLDAWMAVIEQSPTFVQAREDAGTLLLGLEESVEDDVRVVRATTAAGARQVFVGAASEGASFYVECGATVLDADEDLADAIVDVCRATARRST